MASDGWNIAKSFLGWIPGVSDIGDAIDQAANPNDWKQQEQQRQPQGQTRPIYGAGMYRNNIYPQGSSEGYPQQNYGDYPQGGYRGMQGGYYPQNQNNFTGGIGGLFGSLMGGNGLSGGPGNGIGSLISTGMQFLPMFLAEGGYTGQRHHSNKEDLDYDDDIFHYDGGGVVQGGGMSYGQNQSSTGGGLGSINPYSSFAPRWHTPQEQQYSGQMPNYNQNQQPVSTGNDMNGNEQNNSNNTFSGRTNFEEQNNDPSQMRKFAKGGVSSNFGRINRGY